MYPDMHQKYANAKIKVATIQAQWFSNRWHARN